MSCLRSQGKDDSSGLSDPEACALNLQYKREKDVCPRRGTDGVTGASGEGKRSARRKRREGFEKPSKKGGP